MLNILRKKFYFERRGFNFTNNNILKNQFLKINQIILDLDILGSILKQHII